MNSVGSVDFAQMDHFTGFDWAHDKHVIVVVDRHGAISLQLLIEQTAEGWAMLRNKLASLGNVAVAIETNCGPAVVRARRSAHPRPSRPRGRVRRR